MTPARSGWRERTLRRTEEFQRVYRFGKRIVKPEFVIFVLLDDSQPTTFGVTASKRVGSAVRRNRAKRVLREAMRRLLPQITVRCSIVVVARPATTELKSTEILQRIQQVLIRERLVQAGSAAR